METYNGKLCATYSDLEGIMAMDSIRQSVVRGKIEQARRACTGTPALFAVDSLPLKYKTEVYRRFPDMKAQAESKPFIESIEPDGAALAFYQDHLLDDGKHLSTEKQHEYANNAAILNAFRAVLEKSNSQRARQSHRQVNKTEFWRKAAQVLPRCADTFPNSLPENPRRLQEKFNQYLREGYSALITGLYGLRNAAKIMTEEQESVIIKLLADPRNLDNSQIAELYNIICQHFQWKAITPRLVQFYREKHGLITSAGRLGASNFHNVKAMQNKRKKPTAPLLFWTLDGWDVELYYQATETNKKGGNVTTYHHRPTVVVVLDPCEMYPVGYAVGTHETPELIKAALRDAANHTAALFGARYRANQLQSDHYALKTLSGLYGAMSDKVTPARVKNAKSKIIEPYFGYLNKEYCQFFENWSGFGITSDKTRQPNADALNAKRKMFPTFEECVAQVCKMMQMERARKREAYLAKFAEHQCASFNGTFPAGVTFNNMTDDFMRYCSSYNQPFLSGLTFGNIRNGFMFGCSAYNQPFPSSVTFANAAAQFLYGCSSYNQPFPSGMTFGTLATYAFNGCSSFPGPITITRSVSTAFGAMAFNGMNSLVSLRILNWQGVANNSINISNSAMDREALVAFFEDFPATVSGTNTVTITGCVGAADLTENDRLILTNKGYTIVG